jgi:hypothetical protein
MTTNRSCRLVLSASLILPAVLLLAEPILRADPPAAQPTAADLDQLVQTHQYAPALKLANTLLSHRDPAADGSDPYQLWMLKAEAYIGIKSIDSAISSFQAAAKATDDVNELAIANANILLLHNSNSTTYVPKTAAPGQPKPATIPLADRAQRNAAFAALLTDQLSALKPAVDAAAKSSTLPTMYPVLQQLADMKQLDQLVNGNDDKTAKISATLLDHAHNLIASALKEMWARVNDIDQHANQTTTIPQASIQPNGLIGQQTAVFKNGLTSDNKTELRNMIDTCTKIHTVADTFESLAAADKDKDWAAVLNDSSRVSGRASDVLNTDYDPAYSVDTSSIGTYPTLIGNYPTIGNYPIIIINQPLIPTTNPTRTPNASKTK